MGVSALRALALAQLFMLATLTGVRAEELTIVSGETTHKFEIELVATQAERAKGLMFRRRMADNAGMLFDFDREQVITMWMRNTYIPLDMIFAFEDGTIHRIAEQTEPHSEKTISSVKKVRFVLEINGGLARKLGLSSGDRINHEAIVGK